MNLQESDAYRRVRGASGKRGTQNVVGSGYLPPEHRKAYAKRYGSSFQMVRFQLTGDTIAYKPESSKGVFGLKIQLTSPDELKAIARQLPEQNVYG